MTREELYNLALEFGIRNDKKNALKQLRNKLIDYYKNGKGKQELKTAPRAVVEGNPMFPLQEQPVEVIADLLLKEVEDVDIVRTNRENKKRSTRTGSSKMD